MEEENQNPKKLDYKIRSPKERSNFVSKLIADASSEEQFTETYLEKMADYIVLAMDKNEKKEKKILTENRMVTVNKRETSYQGLVDKFENGEDGVFNLITEDKNIILTPKVSITDADVAEIQPLRALKEAIETIKEQEKKATGKRKYLLKKQLIEMCQNQYVIKSEYKPTMKVSSAVKSFCKTDLSDHISIAENGEPYNSGFVSFFNPKHLSALLCNYSALKEESYGNFVNDSYYLMEDLDNLIEKTLKEKYPLYYDLIIYKIDGKQNSEIQILLEQTYNIKNSIEYISNLWRQKIPKLLAKQAQKDALIWYRKKNGGGYWKKCTRCGEIKLAHKLFFSTNKGSKDGWYSICKECRNKK